jgi:hypothetical protein
MNEYDEYKLNEYKKDITTTKFFHKTCCYKCKIFWFSLCLLLSALPILITGLNIIAFAICLPIMLFFAFLIYISNYYNYEEIEIAHNVYYGRVKVNVKNSLNRIIKVLDIPSTSACFRVSRKDYCECILHIWDKFDKNTSIDLRKMYMEKVPSKFYWYFDGIVLTDYFQSKKELETFIGEELFSDNNVQFSSKKPEKNLKIFNGKNFLSFTFNSRIKCYLIFIVILIEIILLIIFSIIATQYQKKMVNNKDKNEKEEGSLLLGLFPGLNMIFVVSLFILIYVYFSYNKKRMDIFIRDNMIYIGITSFTQKSYEKIFTFEYRSVRNFILTQKLCREATLEVLLQDEQIQKICQFTGENKEDLVFFEKKLKDLIRYYY